MLAAFNSLALYQAMEDKRRITGMSWRGIGRELGIKDSAFTRMKVGKHPSAEHLLKMTYWLGVNANHFLMGPGVQQENVNESSLEAHNRWHWMYTRLKLLERCHNDGDKHAVFEGFRDIFGHITHWMKGEQFRTEQAGERRRKLERLAKAVQERMGESAWCDFCAGEWVTEERFQHRGDCPLGALEVKDAESGG